MRGAAVASASATVRKVDELYLAHSKQRFSREAASGGDAPDPEPTSDGAEPVGAVVSQTALTDWLARGEASSNDEAFGVTTLQAVLEAFPCAALVARVDGVVLIANARARAELDRGALDVMTALAMNAVHGVFALPLGPDGDARALILHPDPMVAAATRVARATKQWGLTPQQAEVLRLLVQGEGNKSIAERRACSLRTVEVHMTALFKRTRTASRAELIARFWTFG